ncbi:MAG: protein kinase [Myxococcaceae bacterium]|nr:protein kinase [Myxococcaceae bacterium]
MAELFLARDTRTDALVVIKRILPYLSTEAEFVQMFLDEARIAAQLDHPNVVQVHELGKLEESIFIAMEFVDGVDLRKILQEELDRGAALPPAIAAWIVARICDGLFYAHNRVGLDGVPLQIIHRDVSPQNVMVGYDGRVKLVDFGIAKANSYMERSKPGVIKGKFLYLSPEQLSHEGIDHRADLFAVGTMLYEITTGKSPFYKASTEAVILAIRGEEPPPPHLVQPDYPMELSRIVMRCLVKDRTRRYQQASEIARDLDAWLKTQPVTIDAGRVAAYVAEVFGDEAERTVLHLPASPHPPEPATRPQSALARDGERTAPLGAPVGRRITSEGALAAGAQFVDDDPRTQLASSKEMAEAFRRPQTTSDPPQRRASGQAYPQAGAFVAGDEDGETTHTLTGGTLSVPTESVTPSTRPEKPLARGPNVSVPDPPAFDLMEADDLSVTGSDATPLEEDDFSTVSGGEPLTRFPPRRIVLAAVVAAVLIIVVAAGVKAFSGGEAPGTPRPRPLSHRPPAEEPESARVVPPEEPTAQHVPPPDPVPPAAEESDAGSALARAAAPDRGPSAIDLLTQPLKKATVPVVFRAPKGTAITIGPSRFLPAKTYRLEPGTIRVTYRCPGRRGASGTKAFKVAANGRHTQALKLSCKRR